MKILFSSNRNADFLTFTEYIEKAIGENGCDALFFENRDFLIPGRIRDRISCVNQLDLKILNRRLRYKADYFKPAFFLEGGGWNVLPETIGYLKKQGIVTALWTIDPPRIFDDIAKAAPHYDYVFTQGTEAFEILAGLGIKNLHWMPFACDADIHKPVVLNNVEMSEYACDVSFVGSGWPGFYSKRIEQLESLAEFNLGIWGPGWHTIDDASPIKKYIRGGQTTPAEWIKIYSASKMVFCSHYHDPSGNVPCYQASPRVFEALACGAFLLVDDQRDVRTLFKDGEHLVIYKDRDDLRKKVRYYLEHDDERMRIAKSGMQEVLQKHTFRHRIKQILDITGFSGNG